MDEFYCASCGKHKPISVICARPSGKTPICLSCKERAKIMVKIGDKQRDTKRKHSAARKTIDHLLPSKYSL